MKQRPILFSTAMVEAILNGSKTQTRRILKPQPTESKYNMLVFKGRQRTRNSLLNDCSFGNVGDILWVRETWRLTQPNHPEEYCFGYKIDDGSRIVASEKYDFSEPDVWKPSIHMPKEACRLWLEITEVRIERLLDISEADAKAEGVEQDRFIGYGSIGNTTYKEGFLTLWVELYESVANNPYVWVVEFKKVKKP